MHVFIAGIMQGQRLDNQIDDQSYRVKISQALQQHVPNVQITDPWSLHPNSVDYDDDTARRTFLSLTETAGTADLLIAYLPRMSMGTAMEMWQAYQAGVYIVAITPHQHHWAIKFTANEIFPDLDGLLAWIGNGRFHDDLHQRISQHKNHTIDAIHPAD